MAFTKGIKTKENNNLVKVKENNDYLSVYETLTFIPDL